MAEGEASMVELEPSGDEHGEPEDGMECLATMDDITAGEANYVEYQTAPSGSWHPSKYCASVVRRLIATQFGDFLTGVRKADCEADLRRRLGKGPPVWVSDVHALPVPEGDTHICRLWLAEDGKEYSARLAGSVEVRNGHWWNRERWMHATHTGGASRLHMCGVRRGRRGRSASGCGRYGCMQPTQQE